MHRSVNSEHLWHPRLRPRLRSADHRYIIHIRSRGDPKGSTPAPAGRKAGKARYLGSGPRGVKYYHEVGQVNKTTAANHSALYAETDFLKKSRVPTTSDANHPAKQHSFTTVVVIAGIFMFVTVGIIAAIIVFCRKKNSVFALQKSEQEDDGEYELDELNTDIEYTETDSDGEQTNGVTVATRRSRRKSYPPTTQDTDSHHLLNPFHGHCRCDHKPYHQVVVAAVLEKQGYNGARGDSYGGRPPRKRHRPLPQSPDSDSDQELLNSTPKGASTRNCEDCASNVNNNCSVDVDDQRRERRIRKAQRNVSTETSCQKIDDPSLYVDLPPEKHKSGCYVALPMKTEECQTDVWPVTQHTATSHHSIIDLHPSNSPEPRPTYLSQYHKVSESRRHPARSHSVTDSLSLAHGPNYTEAQSCPQTPLNEDIDPSAAYFTGRFPRSHLSSSTSAESGVGYVLYNPHSSILSLRQDFYQSCFDTACEEVGFSDRTSQFHFQNKPQGSAGRLEIIPLVNAEQSESESETADDVGNSDGLNLLQRT